MMSKDQLEGLTLRDTIHHEVLEASQDPVADDLEPARDAEAGEDVLPAYRDSLVTLDLDPGWHVGSLVTRKPRAMSVVETRPSEYSELVGMFYVKHPETDEQRPVNGRRIGRCRNCDQLIQFCGFCFSCGGAMPSDESSTRVLDTGDILPLGTMNGIQGLYFYDGSWYAKVEYADAAHPDIVDLADIFEDEDWQVHPRVVREEFSDVLREDGDTGYLSRGDSR